MDDGDSDFSDFAENQPTVPSHQAQAGESEKGPIPPKSKGRGRGKVQSWVKALNLCSNMEFLNWLKQHGRFSLHVPRYCLGLSGILYDITRGHRCRTAYSAALGAGFVGVGVTGGRRGVSKFILCT